MASLSSANFNSIKVRLELHLSSRLSRGLCNFNSIKVRLERTCKCGWYVSNQFQFHKGTIRTHQVYRNSDAKRHFNSIKVRLERNYYHVHESTYHAFQFHKGTIRTQRQIRYNHRAASFQFHKGTIRTIVSGRNAPSYDINFNSIKVRLEHSAHRSEYPLPAFQFHKGTIRTSYKRIKIKTKKNSIP